MKKFIYLGLGAVAAAAFIVFPYIVKVKIICLSQFGGCPEDVYSKVQSYNGKSLARARGELSKILKKNYLISDYSLQFKFPNILETNVLVKKPDFAICDSGSGNCALVGSDGYVLSVGQSTTLPKIVISGNLPNPGDPIGVALMSGLKIIRGIYDMYQVGTATVDGNSLVVDISGPIKVIFPLGDNDPQVLLGALRLINTRITSGELAGKYSQVDLRFKNPVLR